MSVLLMLIIIVFLVIPTLILLELILIYILSFIVNIFLVIYVWSLCVLKLKKELENVHKARGHKVNVHIELWVKIIIQWMEPISYDYDIESSIVVMLKNEEIVTGLVKMMVLFVLQVAKWILIYILQPSMNVNQPLWFCYFVF